MKVGLLEKMLAILRRDLLTTIRYRAALVIGGSAMMVEIAAFYYLARAVGPGFRPEGSDYFPFLVVGTGFYTFVVAGMAAFVAAVRDAQQNGTLEVLMTTSTRPSVLVFLSAVSAFSISTVQLLLYIGGGLTLFPVRAPHPNLAACAVIFILSLAVAVSVGILAGAMQIATQRGGAILTLVGSTTWFLTGALFPVSVLPGPLRAISYMIPITHCLQGMRMALLQGAS
ncbi:MAG TPA: ABC transporter permease, partial [Terriglobales bacterium]|nr:ABC transporter permease [Terriglobales bacterium]